MTNELEKQFFQRFGIEPKYESHSCDGWGRTVEVKYFTDKKEANKFGIVVSELEYPEITDSILLELICILTKFYGELVLEQSTDVKDLKEQVLNIFIRTSYKDNFKHQVQALFKEDN